MNAQTITDRIECINNIRDDDEAAHGAEDALYADVLLAIADGKLVGEEAKACAALTLTTAAISFARWCA